MATTRFGKKSEATIPARVQTAQLLSLRHQAILEAHDRQQLPRANCQFHKNEVVIMTRARIRTETGEGKGEERAPLPLKCRMASSLPARSSSTIRRGTRDATWLRKAIVAARVAF